MHRSHHQLIVEKRGENQQSEAGMRRGQLATQGQSLVVRTGGEFEIHQDDVRADLVDHGECLGEGRRLPHDLEIAFALENRAEPLPQNCMVVDQDDSNQSQNRRCSAGDDGTRSSHDSSLSISVVEQRFSMPESNGSGSRTRI